jgi:DNA repair exonuclease SbcCD ATPase subunit
LVDVPANQFANVVSIQKSGEVTGMLAKALIENVYYCDHDDVVQLSSTVKSACPRCSGAMENIGFVESNDPDKAQMVKGILTTVRKNKEVENMSESTEATPETPEAVEETVEAVVEAVEEVKAEVEEAVEEAKEVAEEATSEEEIETVEMKIEALTTAVADISTQILEIKALADAVTKVYSQVGEVSKAVATLGSELNSLKAHDQEFGKRVDAVEKETAFRKSADFGEVMQDQPEMVEKSLWGGRFLSKSDLF